MILLDTHIWIWYAGQSEQLPASLHTFIDTQRNAGIGVSAISCWEVAKLVEYERLALDRPVLTWIEQALALPGIHLLDLTPTIAVASTQLPGDFHRDPADQIIVATARHFGLRLVTFDRRIQHYPHVTTHP